MVEKILHTTEGLSLPCPMENGISHRAISTRTHRGRSVILIGKGKKIDLLSEIGLQFFADDPEEDDETEGGSGEGGSGKGVTGSGTGSGATPPAYVSDGSGGKDEKGSFLTANGYATTEDEYYKKVGAITDEQVYYDTYDLDPDRDYQNTKKTLEYDYMTEMATYGAKAEKLFQMGLSNSGVSDIFQANAYSAYLANVNTAAADKIKAKKANKAKWEEYRQGIKAGWLQHEAEGNAEWGTYESNYDTTLKNDTNSAYQAVLNSGMFTGHRTENGEAWLDYDRISNYLKNMGYSSVVIDAVWKRIEGMDLSTLQNTRIRTGYSSYYEMYSGPDSYDSIYDKLKTDPANYSDEEIDKIMDWIEDDWDLTPDGQTYNHRRMPVYVDAAGNVIKSSVENKKIVFKDANGKVIEGVLETTQGEADDAYNAARTYLSQGTDINSIKALLEADFGAGAVAYAMKRINEIYNSTPAGIVASVNTYVETYSGTYELDGKSYTGYDPENEQAIRDAMAAANVSQTVIDKTIEQLKATFETNVQNGFAAMLDDGSFNGTNGEDIKKELQGCGYTAAEAAEIVNKLTAVFDGDERINAGFTAYYKDYTGAQSEGALRTALSLASANYTAAEINAIVEKCKTYWESTAAGIEESVSGYVDTYSGTYELNGQSYTGYDPKNEAAIRAAMKEANVSQTVIDKTIEQLKAKYEQKQGQINFGLNELLKDSMNVNKTDEQLKAILIRAGLEEETATASVERYRKMDQTAIKNQNVSKALSMIDMNFYDGSEAHKTYYTAMLRNANFSDDDIAGAFELADSAISADESVNASEAIDAGYNLAYKLYDGENWQEVAVVLRDKGYGDYLNEIKAKFDDVDIDTLPAVEEHNEHINRGYILVKGIGSIDEIRTELAKAYYSTNDTEEIIALIKEDAEKQIEHWATYGVGDLSFTDIIGFAEDYKEFEFDDSISGIIKETFERIVNSESDLNSAYAFVGMDKNEWLSKDSGEKLEYILDFIGKNVGTYIDSFFVDNMFFEWGENQIELAFVGDNPRKAIEALEAQLQEYKSKGYITTDGYSRIIKMIENNRDVKKMKEDEADVDSALDHFAIGFTQGTFGGS